MPAYTITPEDILFFRDGRPWETAGGYGAYWPHPGVIFDALHAALWRAFPGEQPWEHKHRHGKSSNRDVNRASTQRFGSLGTVGPFPALDAVTWLFPRPQDVTARTEAGFSLLCPLEQTHPSDAPDLSNLPLPLKYPLASFSTPTKDELSSWWTKAAFEAYLRGEQRPATQRCTYADRDLFENEWHTGIAIDPATQTTGHGETEGKIYSAQYLRLRDHVSLGIYATMPMKNGKSEGPVERITELFPAQRLIIVGGQQRACKVEEIKRDNHSVPLSELLPVSPGITGKRVKWLLLSPAVFPAIKADKAKGISDHPGGWLPNWVAPEDNYPVKQGDKIVKVEKGRVLLKSEPRRQPGESREAWRQRIRQASFLDCRLVAARIPKPVVITGWTEACHLKNTPWNREHGPRPTFLAVPAGAVYYFEGDDAPMLAGLLSWHGAPSDLADSLDQSRFTTMRNRRSTLFGEKGFGLGVCGTWEFYHEDSPDQCENISKRKETAI